MVIRVTADDLSSSGERLEAALHNALKSVLGGAGPGANPRMEFYNKFQREMEEHDRDFEKKYDEDLNTTLIFVSVPSRAGGGAQKTAWDLMLTMRFHVVWSLLGRDIGVYYRRPIGTQAGLRGNEQ